MEVSESLQYRGYLIEGGPLWPSRTVPGLVYSALGKATTVWQSTRAGELDDEVLNLVGEPEPGKADGWRG